MSNVKRKHGAGEEENETPNMKEKQKEKVVHQRLSGPGTLEQETRVYEQYFQR